MGLISFDGGRTFKTFHYSMKFPKSHLYEQFTDDEAKKFMIYKNGGHMKPIPCHIGDQIEKLACDDFMKAKIEMEYRLENMDENIIMGE